MCVLHIPPCVSASHFVCLLHNTSMFTSHHVYVLHTYLSKFCAQQVFCAKSTLWVDFEFIVFFLKQSATISSRLLPFSNAHIQELSLWHMGYICLRKLYWFNLSLAIQGSREQDLGPVQRDHLTPRGDGRPEDLAA